MMVLGKKNKHSILLLLAILSISFNQVNASDQDAKIDSLLSISMELQYVNLDSAINNVQTCLAYYEEIADTNKIIETRSFLMGKYSGMGQYHLAYDYAWSLLPLVESVGYAQEKVRVFHSISILYIMFEQYDQAFYFLEKAIKNANELDLNNKQKSSLLSELYSSKAWLVTESKQDFQLAEALRLKSIEYCNLCENEISLRFQKMHLGQLYVQMDRLAEASLILKDIEKQVAAPNSFPIHSLLYDYLGHLYLKYEKIDSAIFYFKKSVEAIEIHQNHFDIEVSILEILSDCYAQKEQTDMALYYLKKAKKLDESLFGSRSLQNKILFEIKDKHAIQLKNKEDEIKNQKLIILERDYELWIIRSILFVVIAFIVIIFLIARYRRILHKQKIKQELHRKKEELEHQKQAEIIEVKNKELMTSALMLIERDTLLDDIKKFLMELDVADKNKKAVRQVSHSIIIDRSKKWEEFELYFNTVNDSFYEALKAEFPKLTSTDLKMCALIKLGFSSKEMSQIMSIGADGINVSRSRIRKKMGLSRETSLIEYVQNYSIPKQDG